MPFSRVTYTSAGEATYTITFPYLEEEDVHLYVDGVEDTTFTFDDASTARPTTVPTSGEVILIRRDSNREARRTDYVDASVFKAATLDDDVLQAFYICQEAFDEADIAMGLTAAGDEFDGEGLEISNIVGGTDAGDAVEYQQMVNYLAGSAGITAPVDPTDDNKALVALSGAFSWTTIPGLALDNAYSGVNSNTWVQLTDAATVAVDFSTGNNFHVTVTADRTIGAPSNKTNGQSGTLMVIQDGTGGWTTTFHADWNFGGTGNPTPTEVAGDKAVIAYQVDKDGEVISSFVGDF